MKISNIQEYELSYAINEYSEGLEPCFFRDGDNEPYFLSDFMFLKSGEWHGSMSLTNTSAYLIKIDGDIVTSAIAY